MYVFLLLAGLVTMACGGLNTKTLEGVYSGEEHWHHEITENEGIFSEDEKKLEDVYPQELMEVRAGEGEGVWVLSFKSELDSLCTVNLRVEEKRGKELMLKVVGIDVLEKMEYGQGGEDGFRMHVKLKGTGGMREFEGADGVLRYDGVYNTETGELKLGYALSGTIEVQAGDSTHSFPVQGHSSYVVTKYSN